MKRNDRQFTVLLAGPGLTATASAAAESAAGAAESAIWIETETLAAPGRPGPPFVLRPYLAELEALVA